MSTGLFLDFVGIRMDSKQAETIGPYSINLVTPDNGEKYAADLSTGPFTNVEGFLHDDPDLAITINRSDLEVIMAGQKTFMASIEDGTAKAEGNVDILREIAATLINFEIGFEVLPGTANRAAPSEQNPYEVNDSSILIHAE